MRFGFVTCVQLGLSCMEAIYEAGGELDLAVTLRDDQAVSKVGRVYLDSFCSEHGIDLVKSGNVNDAAVVDAIRAARIDWLFIIGWSQIARPEVLAASSRGALGMHPSLLPVGRGRAAIPWAILKGLAQTGVTLFKLAEGVDTGEIIDQTVIDLQHDTDATELYAAVEKAHVDLMRAAFPKLAADQLVGRPQDDERATYWPGRTAEDGAIDMDGSVHDAERLVRAVTRPYPGAFYVSGGRKTIVWKARVADDGPVPEGAPQIDFHDGTLYALDWEDAGPAPTA